MSYDLEVYAKVELAESELEALVRSVAGSNSTWITVDGPDSIDSEDLPEGVGLEAATVLYSVHAPYSVSTQGGFSATVDDDVLAHASAVAAKLAQLTDGVVFDPQAQKSPEPVELPVPSPAPGFLHLCVSRLLDGTDADRAFGANYLRAARGSMAATVPVRFGTHEPMRGRLPRDPDEAFATQYAEECGWRDLIFSGTSGVRGNIGRWTTASTNRCQSISVTLELAKLRKTGVLADIEGFLSALASQTGSFFGVVEANDSRYLAAEPRRFYGAWGGLPLQPLWLTWYGSEYARLVRPYLTLGETREMSDGILHRWTDAPSRAEEISEMLGRDPWVPEELIGRLDRGDGGNPRRLATATLMPQKLRRHRLV